MFKDMSLSIKYRSDENNIPTDFLIPMLKKAILYRRAVGYFSTTSLVDLSVGLCSLAERGGNIEIVCSPNLSEEDIEAINLGYKSREEIIINALDVSLTEPIDIYDEERLNLVATLVANGNLKFKIAFMEDNNQIHLYHEKIAIAYDEVGNRISFTGSMNESQNGLSYNFESIFIFKDWNDSQKVYVEEAEHDFIKLWNNTTRKIKVIDFPQIIIDRLLKYKKDIVNYNLDSEQFDYTISSIVKKPFIKIPVNKQLLEYQKEAIRKWKDQDFIGIYDMATGTGKTYTALGSIEYLAKKLDNKLGVFIVCPYIHLVGQWEEDLIEWGVEPIVAYGDSPDKQWEQHLISAYKRFKKFKKPFLCITTNDTFVRNKIQNVISNIDSEMDMMLVVDEAHNVGAEKQIKYLNEKFKYRLALSATIERHRDIKGTKAIFNYFHEKCIEYPLDKAIKEGKALCKYEYHVIYSFLSDEELNKYNALTQKLKKYMMFEDGVLKYREGAELILFDRKRVLAGASDKIKLLEEAMLPYRDQKYILVYCGATQVNDEDTQQTEKQIMLVNKMLENNLGMDVHKFTAEENPRQRLQIKECFANGMYQVLTAIRCLDEGVNIPNIQTAFILSSSQNPKEFIQRRGRLLRKAPGKEKAVIYDFVTLPRPFGSIHFGDFEKDRSIVIGEMARIKEFATSAENKSDGLNAIEEIQQAYGVSIDLERELELMEEEMLYE